MTETFATFARIAEGWCPLTGHPRLGAGGHCPNCNGDWYLGSERAAFGVIARCASGWYVASREFPPATLEWQILIEQERARDRLRLRVESR